MAVTSETLRIVDRLRRELDTLTTAQTRALTGAWVEAWDVLMPEFQAALVDLIGTGDGPVSYKTVAANIRLRDALQHTREVLDGLAATTGTVVTNDLAQAVLDAVDGHAAVIGSQLPPDAPGGPAVSFTRMDPEALTAIVERATEQVHSATRPLPVDVERAMKRELIRGIAVGENPNRTAARIIRNAEGRFNGGLTRALTIARTETLDAHRAATKASEKANKTILQEWEWSAALTARTCPSCWAMHGTRHPLEEDGPLDHQNGRCARVTVTKTWRELGFDIDEPEPVTRDAEAVFNELTPETQRAIMGPERLRMLQDGEIKWADLSTVKQTPGWRDSHTVTPVRDLGS